MWRQRRDLEKIRLNVFSCFPIKRKKSNGSIKKMCRRRGRMDIRVSSKAVIADRWLNTRRICRKCLCFKECLRKLWCYNSLCYIKAAARNVMSKIGLACSYDINKLPTAVSFFSPWLVTIASSIIFFFELAFYCPFSLYVALFISVIHNWIHNKHTMSPRPIIRPCYIVSKLIVLLMSWPDQNNSNGLCRVFNER